MTESAATPPIDPTSVDFEQVYRSGTLVESVAMDRLPWEIGRPQPLLVEFERAGRISGDVLDIGCGPGDTAIYLARLGYRVTGLDIAPTAIERARAQAAERAVTVSFAVADATELAGYDDRFDTVVSSALIHCLDSDQRIAHVAALRRVLRAGGRLIQFAFAKIDDSPAYALDEAELRAAFGAPDWRITELYRGELSALAPSPGMRELLVGQGMRLDFDADGGMQMPVWVLEAERV